MKVKVVCILIFTMFLTSCSAWFNHARPRDDRTTSSLVKYLYSDGSFPEHTEELPELKVPVTVGVAFVPSQGSWPGSIDAKSEVALLDEVRNGFLKYDFIKRIEVIPSTYLANGAGFTTLEQVARLYDVDVMALVSYDQLSRSTNNPSSLLYWTIVGAYIIPGNTNLTQTFVDTAVFDIATHKMLFRAPGTDRDQHYSTAVSTNKNASEASGESYQRAVAQMTTNLDAELTRFRTRIKEEKVARVTYRQGYSGAGSAGPIGLCLFLLILGGLSGCANRAKGYSAAAQTC